MGAVFPARGLSSGRSGTRKSQGAPAIRYAVLAGVERLEGRQLLSGAGDLDPTFGDNGAVVVGFPRLTSSSNPDFIDNGVEFRAIDSRNGFTVVAGEHRTGSFEAGQTFDHHQLALARLDASGNLDPTFNGTGTLYTDMLQSVRSVFVQTDNKILVVGSELSSSAPADEVVRFNADGSIDQSFGGGDGFVTFDIHVSDVRVMTDGRIVLGGDFSTDTAWTLAAGRLTASGAVDTTFGTNGEIITSQPINESPIGVALQSDGKLLLSSDGAVLRLTAAGQVDTAFGNNGVATTSASGPATGVAVDVAGNGNIFLGYGVPNLSTKGVAKVSSTGASSQLFASLPGRARVDSVRAAFDGSGKVYAFGQIELAPANSGVFKEFVARYNADGSLDTSFGSDGTGIVLDESGDVGRNYEGEAGDLENTGKVISGRGFLPNDVQYFEVEVMRRLSGGAVSPPVSPPPVSPPPVSPPPVSPPPVSPPPVSPPPVSPPPVSPPPVSPPPVASPPPPPGGSGTLLASATPVLPASAIAGIKTKGTIAVAVTNPTLATVSGRVNVDLFFSSNGILDAGDEVLTSAHKKLKLKTGQAKSVKLKVRTFPASATDGTYSLLAQVTAPDGTTSIVAAGTIAVAAQKLDLSGAFVTGTQTTMLPNKKSRLDVLVTNNGNVTLNAPVGLALTGSVSGTPANGDLTLLETTKRLKLKAGQTRHLRLTFRVPTTAATGSYFPVLSLDAANVVAETNEANNLAVGAIPFTIL